MVLLLVSLSLRGGAARVLVLALCLPLWLSLSSVDSIWTVFGPVYNIYYICKILYAFQNAI